MASGNRLGELLVREKLISLQQLRQAQDEQRKSGQNLGYTLAKLGCIERPSSGRYLFAGSDVGQLDADGVARLRNRQIGFVFQSFNLLPNLTALQNVELPLAYAGAKAGTRRERAAAALDQMGLSDRANHLPRALSGGQQQRVAIARALVNQPAVLLADEPTGSLESRSGQAILELFGDLNRGGVTVVMVTHDPSVARHAARVVRVHDGRIVSDERSPASGGGSASPGLAADPS